MCLSGVSVTAKLALTQAESGYQKANIALKIKEHLHPEVYSIDEVNVFLINTNFGLLSLALTLTLLSEI